MADIRCPLPLKSAPDYRGYGIFRFESLDIDGVGLNFEMCKGEFNVNGFVRLLAEAEVRERPQLVASDLVSLEAAVALSLIHI